MGLDMYLKKKTFIGAEYTHRDITGNIDVSRKGTSIPIQFNRVSEITEAVMYWRKENHIHKWFVDNVQQGNDDCGEYEVSKEQLNQLASLCEDVVKNKDKAENELPTQQGFFLR